ncbi:glycosyltransferase [Mucilaginibacter sp. HD30]
MSNQSNKISILINAYACAPNMGSEPGMAWNWCIHLAKHCELHIVTEGEFRDKIEHILPTLPQGANMHFYYNPVSDEVRQMCWNQGDWRFYSHYKKWQCKTYEMALDIIRQTNIDVVHQLNMIGFREPGYLWQIEEIPFVWGPVDVKEKFPVAYLQGGSAKQKLFIKLKNIITILQLKYSPRVIKAFKKASAVIGASSDSVRTVKKYFGDNAVLINETGCNLTDVSPRVINKNKTTLNLLWVGKFDFRKQLTLAIKTVGSVSDLDIMLNIVGGEEEESVLYKRLADKLNIAHKCIWHNKISHSRVQKLMSETDLLFFTSVAEGTPHVVLEAISNCLPVICFDTCGQGDSINDKVGFKIRLSNPKQSQKDFAEILKFLINNRNAIIEKSNNCIERKKELSWDNKAKQMVEIYEDITRKQITFRNFKTLE